MNVKNSNQSQKANTLDKSKEHNIRERMVLNLSNDQKSSEIKISEEKLKEGIVLSLEKSSKYLNSVKVLANNECMDCIAILLYFAIEEFGRAVYLRKRLQEGKRTIEKALQGGKKGHKLKYDNAFSVLPEKLKNIFFGLNPSAEINPFIDMPWSLFGVKVQQINPSTRLKAVYLNFNEDSQKWETDIPISKVVVEDIIKEMEKAIMSFVF